MSEGIKINAKFLSVLFLIVGSTLLVQVSLRSFTNLPRMVPAVIPAIIWTILIMWFYFYKWKKKS
ncbi:hypothetical protein CSV71_10545 [Sporosarcina sp. P21c]|nr:hypothetical protein CSV78_06785 [Sporosarcina sp. P16a]PIC89351.1 hypothetical protein CSV71_10545 [Sporosarcina sp. P21c]PIC93057.1 hypothetical protein CSV70_07535 [Sporosarcina sp. P25]